jgi:hypothetical protein
MSAQGKWNITIETPMGDKTGVLDLVVDGATLSGSLSDADHFAVISNGKIEGNRLEWSAKITKPMRMSFKFTATVDTDRIQGSAKHWFGSVSFHGSRV